MTGFDISTATDIRIGSTQASAVYLGANKIWPAQHDYSRDYLTIISLEDNNEIRFVHLGNEPCTIIITTDTGSVKTWYSKTASGDGTLLATLNTGDKLLLRGNNNTYTLTTNSNRFISTKSFNLEGNIMSLIYGSNFVNQTTLPSPYINTFMRLFKSSYVVSAEHLILPATTLVDHCYTAMFEGCTSLTTVPELPATTLADWCYMQMFHNCTSLTTAPELPATTLAQGCYASMFNGCTSLITAPELPATTLTRGCYATMFIGCTSLTTAPELPVTTLAEYCYSNMFINCSSLNYIKCLATDISANNCTLNWVNGVAATGTFIKDSNMTSWTTGTSGIPSGWAVVDAS